MPTAEQVRREGTSDKTRGPGDGNDHREPFPREGFSIAAEQPGLQHRPTRKPRPTTPDRVAATAGRREGVRAMAPSNPGKSTSSAWLVKVSGLEPPTSKMRKCGSQRFDQALSEDLPGRRRFDPLRLPHDPSPSLSIKTRKDTISGRLRAIPTPVDGDEAVEIINVVSGGPSDLDYRQLTTGGKTLNRRPRHTQIVRSGVDRQ